MKSRHLTTLMALAANAPHRPTRTLPYAPSSEAFGESRSWYRISNAAATVADVHLYDIVGEYGVSARQFVADLSAITAKTINMHINSPGGDVFDGIAIHAALVNHPATVNVAVDGLAASAASFIAMAGDSIGIEKPATMMIHDASALAWGNAADMREAADFLDRVSDSIAGIYADRAGGDAATWRAAMLATTWYSSAEAVAAGLADSVLNDTAPPPPPAEGDDVAATDVLRNRHAMRMALEGWRK